MKTSLLRQLQLNCLCEKMVSKLRTVSLNTCTVAYAFVLDNVLVLERLKDLDLSFKVTYVLSSAVLEFLHSHDLSCVVLKRVISTHLHATKVSLVEETTSIIGGFCSKLLSMQMTTLATTLIWVFQLGNASVDIKHLTWMRKMALLYSSFQKQLTDQGFRLIVAKDHHKWNYSLKYSWYAS